MRVRIEQKFAGIEAQALLRCEPAVNAVRVGLPEAHAVDQGMPDVSGSMQSWIEIDDGERRRAVRVLEQQQLNARRMPAEQREVETIAAVVHAERQRPAFRDFDRERTDIASDVIIVARVRAAIGKIERMIHVGLLVKEDRSSSMSMTLAAMARSDENSTPNLGSVPAR